MATTLEQLMQLIPVDQIAQQVGAKPKDTAAAIGAALPSLLGGLTANSQDSGKADSIIQALGKHQESGVLGSDGVDLGQVDTEDGKKIVQHVFGSQTAQVSQAVGEQAGVQKSLIQKVLPILAPIVMAYVAKEFLGSKTQTANTPAGGGNALGSLLGGLLGGGGSGSQANVLGSLVGGLLGGGGAGSGGGDVLGSLVGGLLGGGEAEAPKTKAKPKAEPEDGGVLGSIIGGILGG